MDKHLVARARAIADEVEADRGARKRVFEEVLTHLQEERER